jgi:hypothetical protein
MTSAAASGASIFKMMEQFGHKSVYTPLGYVRDAELFKGHAGAGVALIQTPQVTFQAHCLLECRIRRRERA